MSASMIINTGTIRNNILADTKRNSPMDIKEKNLAGLVLNTTGTSANRVLMTGVLDATVPAGRREAPELRRIPASEVGKTQTTIGKGVPYSGPMMSRKR